jgi:hypothetical protein
MPRLTVPAALALLIGCASLGRQSGSPNALATRETCARADTVDSYLAALSDARLDGDKWTVPATDAGPRGTGTTRGQSVQRVTFTPGRDIGTALGWSNRNTQATTGGSPAGARSLESESNVPATEKEQRAAIDQAIKRLSSARAELPTEAACRGVAR